MNVKIITNFDKINCPLYKLNNEKASYNSNLHNKGYKVEKSGFGFCFDNLHI